MVNGTITVVSKMLNPLTSGDAVPPLPRMAMAVADTAPMEESAGTNAYRHIEYPDELEHGSDDKPE
jgi:hypothetical protein